MAKSVAWKLFIMLQVLAFSSLVRAMTTKKLSMHSVVSRPITEDEKQAVRNNPAVVNVALDPDSIPWGRQNSPTGNGDEGIRGDSSIGSRYDYVYVCPSIFFHFQNTVFIFLHQKLTCKNLMQAFKSIF